MAIYIIVGIIAYLIGSINFSVLISKKMAGFDVREKGSGNAGTTNMLRSVGKKAAAITLICVYLKRSYFYSNCNNSWKYSKKFRQRIAFTNCRYRSCLRTYISNIFWI